MKRFLSICTLTCLFFLILPGCKEVEVEGIVDEPSAASEVSEPEAPVGNIDPLTGLDNLPDEAVGKKALSVMVSNIKIVNDQQYGLSSAGVCYETLAEGGITRILAVFSDYASVPTIGPVRSVREYYVDFAAPLNTIFVHWGGSDTGYSNLRSSSLQTMDGMASETPFFRDQQISSSKGQEHSNFATAEGIINGIAENGIDTDYQLEEIFSFVPLGETADVSAGEEAATITIPYSDYVTSTFTYDASSKQYKKGQYGGDHVDTDTGETLKLDNVFILYDNIHSKGNDVGHMEMDLIGGDGVYISEGKAVSITWTKGSRETPFVLKDQNGDTLQVNRGKSWVNLVPLTQQGNVTIGE